MSQQWEVAASKANVTVAAARGGRSDSSIRVRAGNAVLETSVGKGHRLSAGISDVVAGVGGGCWLLLHPSHPLSKVC